MMTLPILLESLFLLVCCSGQKAPEQKQSEPGKKLEESMMISTSATVEAIDQESRMITIRGPEGNRVKFKADDSVKNLDQVKTGDKITVHYYQSLAVQVIKMGTAESGEETVMEAAEPGEKPAAAAAKQTTIVATVEAIDRSAPSITLKNTEGTVMTIAVRHPERLKRLKVGDTLKITYREAVAVAVEQPAKSAR